MPIAAAPPCFQNSADLKSFLCKIDGRFSFQAYLSGLVHVQEFYLDLSHPKLDGMEHPPDVKVRDLGRRA